MGATALPAAWVASHYSFELRWFEIWICEAVIAVSLAIVAIQTKAFRRGLPWTSGPGRKVALSFLPPVAAAALLTIPLVRAGLGSTLPGMWSRRQIAERYAARTGRSLQHIVFYYVFGLFKTAVVAQQIYARFKAGLTKDERFAMMIVGVKVLAETAVEAARRGRF